MKPKARQRSHLGLPVLGEHHEGVDQEQHTGDHGEAADQSEEPREVVTLPIGELERLPLLVRDLHGTEPRRADLQLEHDSVARPGAVEHAAFVRHEHLSLWQHRTRRRGAGQRGEGAGRNEHVQGTVREARVETGDAETGHDVADGELAHLAVGEQADPVAGTDVQCAREVDSQNCLVACRRGTGVREPRVRRTSAELATRIEVELLRERVRLRDALSVPRLRGDSHAGGRLGEHAVRVRQRLAGDALVRRLERGEIMYDRDLVDRTETGAGLVADRRVQRVADDERRRDDRGAEQ